VTSKIIFERSKVDQKYFHGDQEVDQELFSRRSKKLIERRHQESRSRRKSSKVDPESSQRASKSSKVVESRRKSRKTSKVGPESSEEPRFDQI